MAQDLQHCFVTGSLRTKILQANPEGIDKIQTRAVDLIGQVSALWLQDLIDDDSLEAAVAQRCQDDPVCRAVDWSKRKAPPRKSHKRKAPPKDVVSLVDDGVVEESGINTNEIVVDEEDYDFD